MVLRTFDTNEELYNQFKSIIAKERENVGEKLNGFIKEYIKVHGDGNPAFTMDQFIDTPTMKAVPAFFRTPDDWATYLLNLSELELQEIVWQSQTIGARAQKRLNLL